MRDPELSNSLAASEVHSLFYRQVYLVTYSQSERQVLKKDLLSAFGIPTGTLHIPYVTAALGE